MGATMSGGFSRRALLARASVLAPAPAQYPKLASAPEAAVALRQDRVVLDILTGGAPFAVYNFDTTQAGTYRPFFHPLFGPGSRPVTQNGEFPGSLRGHHWHRGLFIAHQKVNDCSFWEERAADCGKIVHLGFDAVSSGAAGRFEERLAWRDLAGRDLLEERRVVAARAGEGGSRFLDLGIRLRALERAVTFHQSYYNLLACRVANSMCLRPQKERYTQLYGPMVDFEPLDQFGAIVNSEGHQNETCGGAKAKWCDFSGPLGDGTVGGVAIFDHPSNPRFPTAWHNWNNMTIIASLTYHEPLTLQPGGAISLTYRVMTHRGWARQADVAGAWEQFSRTEPVFKEN
jgi:hypothetical protein